MKLLLSALRLKSGIIHLQVIIIYILEGDQKGNYCDSETTIGGGKTHRTGIELKGLLYISESFSSTTAAVVNMR